MRSPLRAEVVLLTVTLELLGGAALAATMAACLALQNHCT